MCGFGAKEQVLIIPGCAAIPFAIFRIGDKLSLNRRTWSDSDAMKTETQRRASEENEEDRSQADVRLKVWAA